MSIASTYYGDSSLGRVPEAHEKLPAACLPEHPSTTAYTFPSSGASSSSTSLQLLTHSRLIIAPLYWDYSFPCLCNQLPRRSSSIAEKKTAQYGVSAHGPDIKGRRCVRTSFCSTHHSSSFLTDHLHHNRIFISTRDVLCFVLQTLPAYQVRRCHSATSGRYGSFDPFQGKREACAY